MKTVLAVLLLVAVAACSDATNPIVPPPPSFTARVAYCAGNEPDWVAFQDGAGAWTQALPEASNGRVLFAHTFLADRGAIATAFEGGGMTALQVLYGLPEELGIPGDTNPRFCVPAGQKTLQGSVSGLGASDFAVVSDGFTAQHLVTLNGDFPLDAIVPGARDFLATRAHRTNGIDSLTSIILRRGIDVPNGATLPVFDFASVEAFEPAHAQMSLTGDGITGAAIGTRLITTALEASIEPITGQLVGTTLPYTAVPESRLLAGDLQALSAQTHGVQPSSIMATNIFFRAPVDRTVNMGRELVAPTFMTAATAPTLRMRAFFEAQDEYDREAFVSYQQGANKTVGVSMTAAYAALKGAYDLEIPELSGTANFNQAWALNGATQLRWTAVRIGGTLGLGLNAVPFDGAVQRVAEVNDVLVP